MFSPRALFWIAFLGLAGAIAVGGYFLALDEEAAPAIPARAPSVATKPAPQAALPESLTLVPRRQEDAGEPRQSGRGIFETKSWAPPPPPPPAPAATAAPPQAPPLPFHFIGWLDDGDRLRAFLSEGEKVHTVAEGDPVGQSYRVQRVEPNRITFLYVPMSQMQTLQLAGGNALPVTPTAEHAAAPPAAASGSGATATAGAPDTTRAVSPDQLDQAAVAIRIKQQQMRDRARERASRR